MSRRILIVEDDLRLGEMLQEYLSQHGFDVAWVQRGDAAVQHIGRAPPDLVVLDVMLPGLGGVEVCRQVRPRYAGPILMLTALRDDLDQVGGLEAGADDYVIKPCRPRVLLARIHALLRRTEATSRAAEALTVGALHADRTARRLSVNTSPVTTTSTEFDLVWTLMQHAGQVLSRDTLSMTVRGIPYDGLDRSIDIHISRIRSKLRGAGLAAVAITAIRGEGYQLTWSGR